MQAIQKYIHSFLKLGYYKFKYRKKLNSGWVQSFEKIRIDLSKSGKMSIGSYNQNRGNLYLGIPQGELIIGNHCFFNINSSITCMHKIQIGDYCKFGNNLVIVDHDHNYKAKEPEFISDEIVIGNHVWVGANVVILKGTVIGDGCVIAAGSVVKGSIPAYTLFYQRKVQNMQQRIDESITV